MYGCKNNLFCGQIPSKKFSIFFEFDMFRAYSGPESMFSGVFSPKKPDKATLSSNGVHLPIKQEYIL